MQTAMEKAGRRTANDTNRFTRDGKRLIHTIRKYRFFYLLALPGILYFVIFHYLPMFGVIIAFKDVPPFASIQAILEAPWVGLKHFQRFFNSYFFWNVMGNTLVISSLKILFGFPASIVLALMLNEVTHTYLKRVMQTISYLPHFISWVVVAGLTTALFATDGGLITEFFNSTTGQQISFLGNPSYFRALLVLTDVWKAIGWNSIIYLAAISSISPELYEAAQIDGANRFQQAWHVTLPGISYVIAILLIFQIGGILNAGFEQILLLYSPAVYSVSDIIDTYVYREGLLGLKYSYTAAVGVFKSIASLVLILFANKLAHRLGQPGIW